MPEFRSLRRGLCYVTALLSLSLLIGCQQPLAVHDPYFRPGNTSAAAQDDETRRVVRYQRALQLARHSCADPELVTEPRRTALAHVCPDRPRPPTAALGATSNAYRRWVEDRVRELPSATTTAASAAGGS